LSDIAADIDRIALALRPRRDSPIDMRDLRRAVRSEAGAFPELRAWVRPFLSQAPRHFAMALGLGVLLGGLYHVTHPTEPIGSRRVVVPIAQFAEIPPSSRAAETLVTTAPVKVAKVAHVTPPPAASDDDAFVAPLKSYTIDSGFGWRRDPFNGRNEFHAGLDLAAPYGSTVFSAQAGKIVFAGRDKSYGLMVEIDHGDGMTTRYAHLEKILIKRGDEVDVHQQIALLGSTGRSTGPHLHYEVHVDNKLVDPRKFM
jgi:hypothetical protein